MAEKRRTGQRNGKKLEGAESKTEQEQITSEKYLSVIYNRALRVGIRPAFFWQYTPVEILDMYEAYVDNQTELQKLEWKRAAFMAAAFINHSMSPPKRPVKPEDLISIPDPDKPKLTPEEKKRQQEERLLYLAKRSHGALQFTKGKPVIFGKKQYEQLQRKLAEEKKRRRRKR